MTVEREDELHRVPGQLERAADRTASARAYNARYRSAERSQLKSRVIAARTILRHAGRSPYQSTARRTASPSAAGVYSPNSKPVSPSEIESDGPPTRRGTGTAP